MKKFLSLILTVLLMASVLMIGSVSVCAAGTGSFSALCYNVAGLPNFDYLTGGEAVNVIDNQVCIARYVSEKQYDIFATQEDFGYHDNLVGALQGYPNQTYHHGGVPYGDGTNVFTRAFPMYNEEHIVWDQLYGVADDGADEFSQKGITYVCLKIADDVFIDFYDLHADAYGDPGSVAARQDNFRQLAELIRNRKIDRPVIVTGDFNAFVFNDTSLLKETLVDGLGLKDAWVEVKNGGNYLDCSEFLNASGNSWTDKWGVWDSVERFMYKDGGGITLTCTGFEYVDVLNAKGKSCSDHKAAEATFSYTAAAPAENIGSETNVTKNNGFAEILRRIVVFFQKLIFGIRNFDKVREYFGF